MAHLLHYSVADVITKLYALECLLHLVELELLFYVVGNGSEFWMKLAKLNIKTNNVIITLVDDDLNAEVLTTHFACQKQYFTGS